MFFNAFVINLSCDLLVNLDSPVSRGILPQFTRLFFYLLVFKAVCVQKENDGIPEVTMRFDSDNPSMLVFYFFQT